MFFVSVGVIWDRPPVADIVLRKNLKKAQTSQQRKSMQCEKMPMVREVPWSELFSEKL